MQHGFYPEDHFHIRGEIALAEGRYEDAVEAFRRADAGYCTTCALPRLARALEGAGDRRAAIEAYERYLDRDYWWRLGALGFPFRWPAGDWLFLAPTYERLARLYEEEGDLDRAACTTAGSWSCGPMRMRSSSRGFDRPGHVSRRSRGPADDRKGRGRKPGLPSSPAPCRGEEENAVKRIIREIHGRSLWQVLGIYVAGSWVALKVVETLAENENAAKYSRCSPSSGRMRMRCSSRACGRRSRGWRRS